MCTDEVPHTGVVFVHGVGFQEAGDTFADSLAAVTRVVREATGVPLPRPDPVLRARQASGEGDFPLAEVCVGAPDAIQHWVLTEAWWAKTFREPNVASMFTWLGPGSATARVARRLRWRSGDRCEGPSKLELQNELAEQILLSVVTTAGLLLYLVLKIVFAILPISALREATIGPFERFVTGWAGDMRILVADEAQAAMIRRRIADACRETMRLGCDRLVIVAHSGGAVASYMTLADPEYRGIPVAKFITFGAGLNIAWRLLGLNGMEPDEARRTGGRLARRLPRSVKLWQDYWASDDPVPAGPMTEPPPDVRPPAATPGSPCSGVRLYNRLSIREDHGAYLDNDEEFVVPLVNAIHDAWRTTGSPPLVSGQNVETVVRRRRQRVAGLAMWRQVCTALAAFAVLGSIATGVINYWSEAGLGTPLEELATGVLSLLPDMEGPSATLRQVEVWPLTILGGIGYILLPGLVVILIIKIFPWVTGMGSLWSKGFAPWATEFTIGFLGGLLVLATLVAAPGLLALGLASTPFWDLQLSRDLAARLGATQSYNPWWVDWGIHAALLAILLLLVVLAREAFLRWGPSSPGRGGRAFGASAALLAGMVGLSAVAYAIVRSPAFGKFVLGWILIAALAGAAQRLGRWRWAGWDRQERREARTKLAGAAELRTFGRRWDALIFTMIGLGFAGLFVSIAIRPWVEFLVSPVIVIWLVLIVVAIVLGITFDAINERSNVEQRAKSMNISPVQPTPPGSRDR